MLYPSPDLSPSFFSLHPAAATLLLLFPWPLARLPACLLRRERARRLLLDDPASGRKGEREENAPLRRLLLLPPPPPYTFSSYILSVLSLLVIGRPERERTLAHKGAGIADGKRTAAAAMAQRIIFPASRNRGDIMSALGLLFNTGIKNFASAQGVNRYRGNREKAAAAACS